jgi:immune inhibitor A
MENKGTVHVLFLAALFCVAGFSSTAYAVPAAPIVHELRQSDGTIIKAVKWGDEFRHGYETLDGYAIRFDKKSRNWKFMTVDDRGETVLLQENAGVKLPPLELRKHAERIFFLSDKHASLRDAARLSQQIASPTVMASVLVILVNFSNTTPTFTAGDFNNLLFSDNGSYSMRDYYEEVSYGAFTVSPGPGGIAGWYTASKPHNYYGENNEDGKDKYPGTLVREAVAAADAAGFDFSPYDQDGDGYVDCVAIVHQGTGEDYSTNTYDIWSHFWSLDAAYFYGNSDGGPYLTNDGLTIDNYIIMPEVQYDSSQISTIGVFTHEYGHALGLPDLYDIDLSSQGIGYWSVMAYGSWCGMELAGDRPSHPDAWCKYLLGWVTPSLLTTGADNQSVEQAATAPDVYQLRSGSPSTEGEYFLVENRQRAGFDAGLPGEGLLIWHIDESVVDDYGRPTNLYECRRCSKNTSAARHYHVALMQADGSWHLERNKNDGDEGDPYPGTSGNRAFTDLSSPASRLWDGSPSNVRITAISDPGPVMTFRSCAALCSITLIPSFVSKLLSFIKPVTGFIMLGQEVSAFSKDTEIAWSTEALQTLLKVPVGAHKQAMLLVVLVKPWLLEAHQEVEVSIGDCTGGLEVKLL